MVPGMTTTHGDRSASWLARSNAGKGRGSMSRPHFVHSSFIFSAEAERGPRWATESRCAQASTFGGPSLSTGQDEPILFPAGARIQWDKPREWPAALHRPIRPHSSEALRGPRSSSVLKSPGRATQPASNGWMTSAGRTPPRTRNANTLIHPARPVPAIAVKTLPPRTRPDDA
jgi:hypothetical protein